MSIDIRSEKMDYAKLERDLKVVSDQTRLLIIKHIADGQHCGCDLIQNLTITQPTLSHHLKILRDAGFIQGVKVNQRVVYEINHDKFKQVTDTFNAILESDKTCREVLE